MKHSCINCAFCMRCKDNDIWTGSSFIDNGTTELLTEEERKNALVNNFSFIGGEKRKQEEWIQRYEQKIDDLKKGKYNHIIGGPNVLEMLLQNNIASVIVPGHVDHFPLRNKFGMGDMPQAPDKDYLACWHNLWNFKDQPDKFSFINEKNKCLFFYPYTQKGNKSFEGCEKERQALLAQKHFRITNFWVIAGICLAFATSVIIYSCQHHDTQLNSNMLNSQIMNVTNKLDDIEKMSTETQNELKAVQKKGASKHE